MPSEYLRWRRPRIGYARLLSPWNVPNQSQGMDYYTVIDLGHKAKEPLIGSSSELSDGLEPHDTITTAVPHRARDTVLPGRGRVYPGWCRQGGYWEGGIPVPSLRPD